MDNTHRGQGGRKEDRTIPGEKPEIKLKIKIISKTVFIKRSVLDSNLSIDSRQDGKKRGVLSSLFTHAALFPLKKNKAQKRLSSPSMSLLDPLPTFKEPQTDCP